MKTKRSEGFAELLARDVAGDSEIVVGLAGAAERLSWSVLRADVDAIKGKLSPSKAKAIRLRVEEEIDRHTRGLPFRMDVPGAGPLFVWLPLFRFAGCSGPEMGTDGVDEPTWAGDWREREKGRQAEARSAR